MQITGELITYLEKLGRIELSDAERVKCSKDLQDILSYIDTLNELDTEGVEPMSHSFPIKNVFHEDEVKPSTNRSEILSNAPHKTESCYKVPKTVE